MKKLLVIGTLVFTPIIAAQQNIEEKRVPLTETAVALAENGSSALEANLLTTSLMGTPDTPVMSIRLTIRNSSAISYSYVSGIVTFYDASGVRCGEGVFNADALAAGESFETDTPGVRVRCPASSWRIVATNLVPRLVINRVSVGRLIISIDGQEHPIQLDKPLTLSASSKPRTIVLRELP